MKRTTFMMLSLGLIMLFTLSFQIQADMHETETMTLKGEIIDNMCASNHEDDLEDFVATHTKACALMPSCVDSGYSLFVDGKLHKFDEASNKKIEEFLRKDDSKLQVEVRIAKKGDMISLVSIKNQ